MIEAMHKFATENNLTDTARHHMMAPMKVAHTMGHTDVLGALGHVDALVAEIKRQYSNPRTSRNYINGLKTMNRVPEVRRALGARAADVDRRLNAELSDLNHASYQMARRSEVESPQQLVERLTKENEVLRKMLRSIHALTGGV